VISVLELIRNEMEVTILNNTEKAKHDLAEKMLKGRIDVEEIAMMTGISTDEIAAMKKKMEDANPEAKAFDSLDFKDFDIGPVIYDQTEDLPGYEELEEKVFGEMPEEEE
jgi:hypothetical protein